MTIREIAKLAGVSPSTVSNVINNRNNVGKETKKRVEKIISEYNYETNKKNKKVSEGSIIFLKYRTHGKAVEENGGFISSIIDNIERLCKKHSYDLQIINADPQNINYEIENINAINPTGVIFLGTEYRSGIDNFLKKIRVPLVTLDNSMKEDNCDSILMDNRRIAILSVSYLKELGHKNIGYIKSSLDIDNLSERYLGYVEQMNKLGLEPMEPIEVTPTLIDAYEELSARSVDIKWNKYDALVCDLDVLAIATIRTLQEQGIKIPQDISVIGVDDISYSSIVAPALTTIKISRSTLAYYTMQQLRRRIKCKDSPSVSIKICGELVVRDSTSK